MLQICQPYGLDDGAHGVTRPTESTRAISEAGIRRIETELAVTIPLPDRRNLKGFEPPAQGWSEPAGSGREH